MRPTLALMALGFTFIFGSQSSLAQTINACAKPNGNLKVVSDPTACANNETPISWNVHGPSGPPGESGMDGEPGPQGPPGPTLRVFDANGGEVGLLVGFEGAFFDVFLETVNSSILVDEGGRIVNIGGAFFTGPQCDGQAYVGNSFAFIHFAGGDSLGPTRAFVARPGPGAEQIAYGSTQGSGDCNENSPDTLSFGVPADEVALSDLGLDLLPELNLAGPLSVGTIAP